ncbi:hypothetical protein Pla8534_44000 [Lignipirellula cremea]|uniref:DUF1549 domain-containing protein n=1 Tax=Lignipirellula cremea TaxID=2528010 RepID=A0A518DXK2_9BACT|nr:hypothetical protein Pla8534_44000 [Lignipirellula cremea]
MWLRNPKSEARNPKQIQMSKFQIQNADSGVSSWSFAFWNSDLFRISTFGFRVCCLIFVAASLCQAADPVSQFIDAEINAALQEKKLTPAPRAADAELLRRIYLDVLGRIPTADEATRYLDDASTDKHDRLIDELLAQEEMPAYWRTVLDEWLNGNQMGRDFGQDGFLTYLEDALKSSKPWDRIARELLTPDLKDENQRRAAYFLALRVRGGDNDAKIDALTAGVASGLFGVQLQCAKCHDHPFVDQWKQDHYYGLAAFLGRTQEHRLESTPAIKERAEGEVKFVTTEQEEKTAKLMFLDSRVFDEPPPPEDRGKWYAKADGGLPETPYFSRRAVLADYAISADSPFFKRAIVNRMWKQLMGRGLVEPVDQMHEANPASHPELLERLANDFAGGFDLRRLMAGILHSDAYLRSTRWSGGGERPRDADYATAIMKPLTPDQLATSIGLATGHFDQLRAKFEREKKNRKIDEITPSIARALYSRERDVQEFAARFRTGGEGFEANAGQALFLSYNNLMQRQLNPSQGNLTERMMKQNDNAAAARDAFLTILSRPPTDDELTRAAEFLTVEEQQRRQTCTELVWSLLCSSEFRFNH